MALYHFDEGEGEVLHDCSGNGHHGQIVGAKWVEADGVENGTSSDATEVTKEPAPAGMGGSQVAPLGERRSSDNEFAAATKKVEEEVAAWDFAGAWKDTEAIQFDERSLQERLEKRREEIQRMEALKNRAIEKLAQAKPPLKKSDLRIRGMGGTIVDAGPAGITTKTLQGETERLYWKDLGTEATAKLMELVVEPKDASDLVTAALLTLASGDEIGAERFFKRAREAGADVSAELGDIATNELAAARDLFVAKEYEKTLSSLDRIKEKRTGLPWFEENRDAIDALAERATRARDEAAAETIYSQAVDLLKRERLFDLRDAVQQLEADYAHCRPVVDTTREPLFSDLKKAVADLGARLTVRSDGAGMYRSIQAAIDAARPDCLIEIQDSAVYDEMLLVSEEKIRLTIQGAPGCWPVVTCSNAKQRGITPVMTQGTQITFQRLLFVRPGIESEGPFSWFAVGGTEPRLRHCLICNIDCRAVQGGGQLIGKEPAISDCVVGKVVVFDNVLPDKPQVAQVQFRDPANLDFRLAPGSPGTGMASDAGDIGCRYTAEMVEMCRVALGLRAQGLIRF